MSKERPRNRDVHFWHSGLKFDETGGAWGGNRTPLTPAPEPVYIAKMDKWPSPKPRTDLVFAKSCRHENWCTTDAGTETEPAANFGKVMISGAMPVPSGIGTIAAALGADLALGRIAGGGIMQQRMTWLLRGAGGPASVFILGMLPGELGDGTLHTDEHLRSMSHAPTRVRFQFRRDADGVMQVYGIHTCPKGDDSVPTVQAQWNADKTALEAELNGITLLWTPRQGPLGEIPPLTYPDNQQMGAILVHPIPDNTDSQIEGLPGEDLNTEDCIVVFPASTGLRSMYVVFAKPFGGDHNYFPPPLDLIAFPDVKRAKGKMKVQGGGSKRRRWKDAKGRIYEWDSQHGTVELYDRQGKHLGEFNPVTGEQTKPAKDGRTIEK